MLYLLTPCLEFRCHGAVVKCRPDAVGNIVSYMPQRTSIESKITCFQVHLDAAGHASTVFQTDFLPIFCNLVLQIWTADWAVRKPFRFAREVVPQVAARHEPSTAIVVKCTVYLIEEVYILESLIPSFQL